ncbi:MAG: hypothetical protein LBT25_01065 [Candidatus Symbiothrix sp.]|jgi:hypothetical protein|nr:hypothetical protein [Candidatus Symbiothrix sp.]
MLQSEALSTNMIKCQPRGLPLRRTIYYKTSFCCKRGRLLLVRRRLEPSPSRGAEEQRELKKHFPGGKRKTNETEVTE